MAGTLRIAGRDWIERYQEFPFEVTITSNLEIRLAERLSLPGLAPFYLKALKMKTVVAGALSERLFKWKFGNTDGGIWYTASGIGGLNSRILSSLIFGDAQFPKVLTPFILYQSSASIPMEFEDLSSSVPYTIMMSFEGSLLFPASAAE